MKRRGVTIIAILLMLVVLATLVGALAIAGSGTLNGQFVATRGEEARRAAEAGAQAAIAHIQAATSPVPGWLYSPTSVAPVPWQKMETVDSEYQVLHVDHTSGPASRDWILPGNPATGILPTVVPNAAPQANAIAEVPAGATLHYLYSTGRTHSGHYRSIGVLYTTGPGVKILSWQVF